MAERTDSQKISFIAKFIQKFQKSVEGKIAALESKVEALGASGIFNGPSQPSEDAGNPDALYNQSVFHKTTKVDMEAYGRPKDIQLGGDIQSVRPGHYVNRLLRFPDVSFVAHNLNQGNSALYLVARSGKVLAKCWSTIGGIEYVSDGSGNPVYVLQVSEESTTSAVFHVPFTG